MPFTFRFVLSALLLCLIYPSCSNEKSGEEKVEEVPDSTISSTFSLDELERRTFHYFWDLALEGNLQIPDRYPTERFSSIAATGFGLAAYVIGSERGFVSRGAAAERVRNTLEVLLQMPQGPEESLVSGYKGFFYHFLTNDKGLRYRQVELSSIDTGLLMAGVLTVMSYFKGDDLLEREIRELAQRLYKRVEWNWFMLDSGRLSMGYHPEKGFLEVDWRGYNEAMILLVLALGSPTHPIPQESWTTWCSTYEWDEFYGQEHVNFSPLFGHQYSQMFIDFRGIKDSYMKAKGIDYFENSRRATYANRAYCIDNPLSCRSYSAKVWGLTACDGPMDRKIKLPVNSRKYMDYAARGASSRHIIDDCTIAPTAAGGSIPFAPEICIPALKEMWEKYHPDLVGKYGFKDAFNLDFVYGEGNENGWFDIDYLGIDQGAILIQLANHKDGIIWNTLRENPYIIEGLKKAGFAGGWLDEQI